MPEPTKRDFLDPGVLARLGNVPLFSRQPMQGNISGRHKSPHRGSSVEFAEYRKYEPGDDTRRLDWRVYGRSDRFYIKEFEADTNLRCYLVIDTSASMGFTGDGESKIAYARKLAATLAYLCVNQGDAVGLACSSEELIKEVPPRRNPAHLQLIYQAIEEAEPQGKTGLVEALHGIAEKIQQRALVILFSDLFTEPAELSDCFGHLQFRKHDVAAFHLLDRSEIDFKFDRPLRFVDMEDDSSIVAEPNVIQDRYHESLKTYLDEVKGAAHRCGVDYHRVITDENYEEVLRNFLMVRTPKKAG